MKVAIIHDWLTVYAGAERVLEEFLRLFPDADIFTIVDFMPQKDRHFLAGHKITTSFIQRLPFAKTKYRQYLPLMPLAVEQFDLRGYDLVISSSHAVAKGVLSSADQLHISYIHSPMRYAWDLHNQYLAEAGFENGMKGWIARWILHKMRLWDLRTVNGVDNFIANSHFIRQRIWKTYRRDSTVIYPPVNVEAFECCEVKQDFYLTVSRLVPYKKINLLVQAFGMMPEKRLVVIGDGPDYKKIQKMAMPNVTLLGHVSNESVKKYMQQAKAFVFVAEEDFGIAVVEAQACGTPVIAYGKGGALETVMDGVTGLFFREQSIAALTDAINCFEREQHQFKPVIAREHALKFGKERFLCEIKRYIERQIEDRFQKCLIA